LSSYLLKQLMINCQATFCTPLKSVKIGRALLETSNCGRNFNIVEKGKKKLPMESVVRTSMTFFFLANQTSFKDEFLLTAFFIDDQFFDINLK
jgi:hypothetical protein